MGKMAEMEGAISNLLMDIQGSRLRNDSREFASILADKTIGLQPYHLNHYQI